jgi:hypothetical protein
MMIINYYNKAGQIIDTIRMVVNFADATVALDGSKADKGRRP